MGRGIVITRLRSFVYIKKVRINKPNGSEKNRLRKGVAYGTNWLITDVEKVYRLMQPSLGK